MKQNNRWAIMYTMLGIVFLVVTNISYINYESHETSEYQYTGANAYAAADKLVYLSMIEQGRDGALFVKNLHTTDPQKGVLFSPHWYLIGATARLFNISTLASYQLYRILFTLAFLVALFFLISKLTEAYLDRLGMTLFALFSGGLGWLYIAFRPEGIHFATVTKKFLLLPTDMYVTEGNTLLNFAQAPLFSLSQLLILLMLFLFVAYRNRASIGRNVLFGLMALTLSIIHPYDIPLILVVLGSWTVWHTTTTRALTSIISYAAVLTGIALGSAYHVYTVTVDPVIQGWLSQNLVYSPPLHLYFWGYGLLVPFAAVGLWRIVRSRTNEQRPWWMLIALWVLVTPILLYLPTSLNRRFINGFHLALALVAYQGFRQIWDWLRIISLQLVFALISAVALMGSMIFFLMINVHFDDSLYTRGLYYTSSADRAAVDFLRTHSPASANLLVLGKHANFVMSAMVPRAVFRGHDHQVPRFELRDQQLTWFIEDQNIERATERKREFLETNRIDYVVIDDTRVSPRIAWVDEVDYLERVYDAIGYRIYKVVL